MADDAGASPIHTHQMAVLVDMPHVRRGSGKHTHHPPGTITMRRLYGGYAHHHHHNDDEHAVHFCDG